MFLSPPIVLNLLTIPFAGPFFSSRSYECMNESRLVVSKADYNPFLVDMVCTLPLSTNIFTAANHVEKFGPYIFYADADGWHYISVCVCVRNKCSFYLHISINWPVCKLVSSFRFPSCLAAFDSRCLKTLCISLYVLGYYSTPNFSICNIISMFWNY